MYDIIYDEMIAAGVAEKLETPIYCVNKGKEVDNVKKAFCKKAKVYTVLTYPNYVLFADETESNTYQKNDRHIAGKKYIPKKEQGHSECLPPQKEGLLSFPSL